MTDRELMQMALDALEAALSNDQPYISRSEETAEALRARLAQPEPEPVAYLCENAVGHKYFRWKKPPSTYKPIALYTAPPQREWQGLTDEEYEAMAEKYVTNYFFDTLKYARAIEAKLKEKNRR